MANQIYYSVCPQFGTDDLMVGSPNISISTAGGVSTAVLDVEQTGNIGQGCEMEYGALKCYITGVVDGLNFEVITATGGEVPDQASTGLDSIHHVWSNILDYSDGYYTANYIDNASLVDADVIANCVCYGSTVDTSSTYWNEATTGSGNYVKVYTPVGLPQSILNNRHQGVYSTDYYRCETSGTYSQRMGSPTLHMKFEGLQFEIENYVNGSVFLTSVTDFLVSHSIFKQIGSLDNAYGLRIYNFPAGGEARVFNNLFYDFIGTSTRAIDFIDADLTVWFYNNTIKDCSIGIDVSSVDNEYMINNIVDCATNCFVGTATSGNNDYNFGTDGGGDADFVGPNGNDSAVITYVATGSDDFHLDTESTNCIGEGDNLYSDADLAITDDIDGDSRADIAFDVGFDQAVLAAGAVLGSGSGFTNYLESNVLDDMFGAQSYSIPANLYLALSTTRPTDSGTNVTEPSVANGYQRSTIANNKSFWSNAAGSPPTLNNLSAIQFDEASGSWGTVAFSALYDSGTGGNVLCVGELFPSYAIESGDVFGINVGQLNVYLG